MEPVQIGLLLATPTAVAVVGALLWWRMGRVEREVHELRNDRVADGLSVAKMQGTVETLRDIVMQAIQVAASRRGKQSGAL